MAKRTFCDRCGVECKATTDNTPPSYLVVINVGTTDEKEICPPCYALWREAFFRFFQKQGQ